MAVIPKTPYIIIVIGLGLLTLAMPSILGHCFWFVEYNPAVRKAKRELTDKKKRLEEVKVSDKEEIAKSFLACKEKELESLLQLRVEDYAKELFSENITRKKKEITDEEFFNTALSAAKSTREKLIEEVKVEIRRQTDDHTGMYAKNKLLKQIEEEIKEAEKSLERVKYQRDVEGGHMSKDF